MPVEEQSDSLAAAVGPTAIGTTLTTNSSKKMKRTKIDMKESMMDLVAKIKEIHNDRTSTLSSKVYLKKCIKGEQSLHQEKLMVAKK